MAEFGRESRFLNNHQGKPTTGSGRKSPSWLRVPGRCLVLLFKGYQCFLSPLFPPACRFVPTCSQYAIEAVEKHGAVRGLLLALWRLMRCHPFCRGGYDPVK